MSLAKPSSLLSFKQVLKLSEDILNKNSDIAKQKLAAIESELLVMRAFQLRGGTALSRFEFLSMGNVTFPEDATVLLLSWLEQRARGYPLQYLTGVQVFLDHEYEVVPGVLIPRPETELLVVEAIQELSKLPFEPQIGIEIGVGTGAISIELLSRFPQLKIYSSEVMAAASECAKRNAERILKGEGTEKNRFKVLKAQTREEIWEPFDREFSQSALSSASRVKGQVDFLITNPPYLSASDCSDFIEAQVLNFEPHEALFSPGKDSLFFYREIAKSAHLYLRSQGFLFAEIPHNRSDEIVKLFSNLEWKIEVLRDLTQRERILKLQRRA